MKKDCRNFAFFEILNAIMGKIEYNHSSEIGMEGYIVC